MAQSRSNAEYAVRRSDEQRQVDDHREVLTRPPAGQLPRSRANLRAVCADSLGAVGQSVLRRTVGCVRGSAAATPTSPRTRIALALISLRATGVQMLVIDELYNLLAGSDGFRREFLNLLRYLGNELRVLIVGVGTREAYQVRRGFEVAAGPEFGDQFPVEARGGVEVLERRRGRQVREPNCPATRRPPKFDQL